MAGAASTHTVITGVGGSDVNRKNRETITYAGSQIYS